MKVCSKCKKEKKTSDYQISDKVRGYYDSMCKKCRQDNKTIWREIRRKENRAKILQYLGGEYKCTSCGFSHNTPSPFDWHHTGDNKLDSPMRFIHSSWDKLKTELDKCIFLCSNCHRIHHHG